MKRIEEFAREGRYFIYLNLSNLKTNDDFRQIIEDAQVVMSKYAPNSLYTITNVANTLYDTETKEMVADWMARNKDYVKYGCVIGLDGMKKLMINAIFKLSKRKNVVFLNTKEQAIAWLLAQD